MKTRTILAGICLTFLSFQAFACMSPCTISTTTKCTGMCKATAPDGKQYTINIGGKSAKDLKVGDQFIGANNQKMEITKITKQHGKILFEDKQVK